MENLEDIFKGIALSAKTQNDKNSTIKILDEFIKQIDRAEREFSDLKDVYDLILEALPYPIWVINQDGSYFYYNSYAKKIDKILEICPKDFVECEILFNKENYLMQKSSKNEKILITATNITNEKQKERLASMGQISAHLAHEIRNPIGAIALMLSQLLKNIDSKNKIYILEMKKALWRVERLIETTLLFSKGVKSASNAYNSEIIKESVEDSVVYFEYFKNIDFIYDIKSDVIVCDRELLELLMQNLVLNAIEAIEEREDIQNGMIRIEFYRNDEAQFLKIYDNGLDISDTESVFEAFKSTKVKGNGLGLALCKQIAQAHNGEITFQAGENKYFCVKLGI